MNSRFIQQADERKRGIAIVTVLGLMAVLMIAAVAFGITMRMERRGSSNYRYGVQTRHMLWAALVNAIEDIHSEMHGGGTNFVLYPAWDYDVMASSGGEWSRVLSRDALRYLPYPLDTVHTNEFGGEVKPYWRNLKIEQELLGRYSYRVYNTSGRLDINYAGARTNRLQGVSAREMRLDILPGLDVADFFNWRDEQHMRYETFDELMWLNPGVDRNDHLCLYSRAPVRKYYDGTEFHDQVFVGGTVDELELHDSYTNVTAALEDCGLAPEDAKVAFTNLLDYIDADSNVGPKPLNHARVERVPMINEVIATLIVTNIGGATRSGIMFQVEWFYPFVTDSSLTFDFAGDIRIQPGDDNSDNGLVPGGPLFDWFDADVTGITGGSAIGTPRTLSFFSPIMGASSATNVRLNIEVTIAGEIIGPDGVVDQVPAPYEPENGVTLEFDLEDFNPQLGVTTSVWAECIDPRFNWHAVVGAGQWMDGKSLNTIVPGHTLYPTPEKTNNTATLTFNPSDYGVSLPYDTDGDAEMHVADRPLRTVGELGNICYAPWSTIRLYKHGNGKKPFRTGGASPVDYHNVLDYFTIHSNEVEAVRGAVNINTKDRHVLATAFYDAPEEEYDPAGDRISDAAARQIADQIIAGRGVKGYNAIGRICEVVDWEQATSGSSELAREGPIRNTCELLTVRHNLFTIVVRGQPYTPLVGGVGSIALTSVHAVADVWRDPFPDENGNYPCFVRSFRIIGQ